MRAAHYFDHTPSPSADEFHQLLNSRASLDESVYPSTEPLNAADDNSDDLFQQDTFGECPTEEKASMLSQSVLVPLRNDSLPAAKDAKENVQLFANATVKEPARKEASESSKKSQFASKAAIEMERADLAEFEALEKALQEEEADFYSARKSSNEHVLQKPDSPRKPSAGTNHEADGASLPPMSGLVRRMFQPKSRVVSRGVTKKIAAGRQSSQNCDTTGVGGAASINRENQDLELREKVAQLESEIQQYQEASQELESQKKKVFDTMKKFEKMQGEIKHQQQEFTRVQQEKREDFESWMNEEKKRLKKERGNLERQKQRILLERTEGLKDRKDRTELETLKATISKLRAEKDSVSTRMKGVVQAKDERIHNLEEQVSELETALALAEERRIDAWDKQIQLEADLIESRRELESLQTKVKTLERHLEGVRASPHQDRRKSSGSLEESRPSKKKADDRQPRVVKYKNGTTKSIHEDGTVVINFCNGDVSTERPNGESSYFYKGDNITQTTSANGTQHIYFPDGQVERIQRDGSREILKLNR